MDNLAEEVPVAGGKRLLNVRHDLAGNTLRRQMVHWVRTKVSIMGNYNTGPGLRCLSVLFVLHYLGRPLFFLKTWADSQFALKRKLKAAVNRLRPGQVKDEGKGSA